MKTRKFDFRNVIIKGSRIIVLLVLCIFFAAAPENFFGFGNYTNITNIILQQAPFVIMLALSMTMSMVVGGIDLSIGSNISLSSFICAMVLINTDNILLGIISGILVGACVGFANGVLVAKVGLPPFVATYGMDWIAKGAVLVISKGGQLSGFNKFRSLFNSWRGTYILITVIILAIIWFAFRKTTLGKRIYCVGANPVAAELSGMKSKRILIAVYILSGFVAAITGMMYIANLGSAEPTLGHSLTKEAIAAALIGGASFVGAKSKISNALVGGLILVILRNGLIHIGVPGVWSDFAQGLVIILAIVLEFGLEKLRRKDNK